ncbi:MAG TPA: tetratricopeptide repeat protein, partial [Myxococcaceae bacterium]
HRTELAHTLGTIALGLTELKPDCVNYLMGALYFESLVLGRSRAHIAHDRLGALVIMLAAKAVSLGAAGAEALYSAAKRIHDPQQALNVYQDILKLHPAYEARWYWQRDVGSLLYGMGRHLDAARHYDRAVALKPENSKLHRYAGDAYYYAGEWSEAAQRFQRAVSLEPMEKYFVEPKLTYCRAQLSAHEARTPSFVRRRKLAGDLADIGAWMEDHSIPLLPGLLFRLSLAICTLSWGAAVRLAQAANRRGSYARALHWSQVSLMSVPEDPGTWLNAAVNVLFLQGGQWTDLSRTYAKAALFFGGPEAVERLRVRLVNTPNGDELLAEFEHQLLEEVRAEREAWLKRRAKILAPENYGDILHLELDEP